MSWLATQFFDLLYHGHLSKSVDEIEEYDSKRMGKGLDLWQKESQLFHTLKSFVVDVVIVVVVDSTFWRESEHMSLITQIIKGKT